MFIIFQITSFNFFLAVLKVLMQSFRIMAHVTVSYIYRSVLNNFAAYFNVFAMEYILGYSEWFILNSHIHVHHDWDWNVRYLHVPLES